MPAIVRFLLISLTLLAGTSFAQDANIQERIEAQTEDITAIAVTLTDQNIQLLPVRDQLVTLKQKAVTAQAEAYEMQARLQEDLKRLGTAIEGEAQIVATRRNATQNQLNIANAAISQANLNIEEADRLLAEIAERRRARFYEGIFEHRQSPLLPGQLDKAFNTVQEGWSKASETGTGWIRSQQESGHFLFRMLVLAVALILAIIMAIPVRLGLDRFIRHRLDTVTPSHSRKVLVAGLRTVSRALPAMIGLGLFFIAVISVGNLSADIMPLARSVMFGLIAIFLVDSAAASVFAPKNDTWRLIRITDNASAMARAMLVLGTVVIVLEKVLGEGALLFGASLELTSVQRAIVSVLLGLVLIGFSRNGTRLQEKQVNDGQVATKRPLKKRYQIVAYLVLLVGAFVIGASLYGYTGLGHFLATRTFYLIALVAGAFFTRALLREAVRVLDNRFSSSSRAEEGERMIYFWIGVMIDALILFLVLPVVFLLFGADWADVRNSAFDALTGFQIGSVRISILQVLFAVAIFVLLLGATRFIQRTAENRIFPRTRMDVGVQNSLKTLIGYIGLIIAFMTGVGMLGFDLSNLAIIAGALSVGIGFGLQSIVNNFVSGLILLFERPIKVGDWIVTASGEGIVKKISVRSTEIETFDRSSIIVPNSELISSSVVNWTHKNKLGRVTVAVGVSYNEDPDKILDILKSIPKKIDMILRNPEPLILFTGFGDSSLDFEIRAYIPDVGHILNIRTQIRKEIFKAFKDAGVEIPFPQRDLHLRSSDVRWDRKKEEPQAEG